MAKIYKDDILDTSVNTRRKYRMIQNADGTVSFEDATTYLQIGDNFGAADINELLSGGNIRYNQETDKVQIMDTDGVWHDWKRGGLGSYDLISELVANGFTVTGSSAYSGNVSASGNSLVVTGSGSADGYGTVVLSGKKSTYMDSYGKLVVKCSKKNVVGDITVSIVNEINSVLTQKKITGTGTIELDINGIEFGYIQFSSYLGKNYGYTLSEIYLTN